MRVWRVTAVVTATLALTLAAVFPDGVLLFPGAAGPGIRVGRMTLFWIGVALALATMWARGT